MILFALAVSGSVGAQTIVLSEGFEANFPDGWQVTTNAAAWGKVSSGSVFGAPHGGSYSAYCAGAGYECCPLYPNSMATWMHRTIDLTAFQRGILIFWYNIPSDDSVDFLCSIRGNDADHFQVRIDGDVILSSGIPTKSWIEFSAVLDKYAGGKHDLWFGFTSDSACRGEGAYLDDILIAGYGTMPVSVSVNDPKDDRSARNTQNEPSVALAADGSLIVAFNDSGSTLVATNKFTGWALSTNDLGSFLDLGTLPSGIPGDAGDPVLATDTKAGFTYLATIVGTNELVGPSTEPLPGSRIQVFRSSNNGRSFDTPVNGAPGFVAGDHLDKPWLAVDNAPGEGQGNVYLAFRDFPSSANGTQQQGIYVTRSLDGGVSWGPSPGRLVGVGGQGAFVVVGPGHELYLFWLFYGSGARINLAISLDQGLTFSGVKTVTHVSSTAVKGDLGLDVRTDSFPRTAVNPATGHLYVVYNDKGTVSSDLADIFLTVSSDRGTNWSQTPFRINQDTSSAPQWFPTISVAPDGGHVFIAWYDRRLAGGGKGTTVYGVIGTVSETNVLFGSDFRVSDAIFSPPSHPDVSVSSYLGDYIQTVANWEKFYVVWTDVRTGDPDIRITTIALPDEFASLRISGSGVKLMLNTNPGRIYNVQSSTDLKQWTTFAAFRGSDFTSEVTDTNLTAGSEKFYRAITR